MFDTEEYERWLAHAKYTLDSAEDDMKAGKFSWGCFKCQQAAEFALKALLYGLGSLPTGHSLIRLFNTLGERGFKVEDLLTHARRLDRHYVPTRYPNAHAVGAPFEYYDYETANEALNSAKAIVRMVEEAAAGCT